VKTADGKASAYTTFFRCPKGLWCAFLRLRFSTEVTVRARLEKSNRRLVHGERRGCGQALGQRGLTSRTSSGAEPAVFGRNHDQVAVLPAWVRTAGRRVLKKTMTVKRRELEIVLDVGGTLRPLRGRGDHEKKEA